MKIPPLINPGAAVYAPHAAPPAQDVAAITPLVATARPTEVQSPVDHPYTGPNMGLLRNPICRSPPFYGLEVQYSGLLLYRQPVIVLVSFFTTQINRHFFSPGTNILSLSTKEYSIRPN